MMSASARLSEDVYLLPRSVSLADTDPAPWPLASVLRTQRPAESPDLGTLGWQPPGSIWPEPTNQALVLPIAAATHGRLAGLLVVGVRAYEIIQLHVSRMSFRVS
jgi:hypothetical protein